jgi:hypothetical protein
MYQWSQTIMRCWNRVALGQAYVNRRPSKSHMWYSWQQCSQTSVLLSTGVRRRVPFRGNCLPHPHGKGLYLKDKDSGTFERLLYSQPTKLLGVTESFCSVLVRVLVELVTRSLHVSELFERCGVRLCAENLAEIDFIFFICTCLSREMWAGIAQSV